MNGQKVIGSMEKERNGLNNLANNNLELWNQRLFYINKKIKSLKINQKEFNYQKSWLNFFNYINSFLIFLIYNLNIN